MKSAPYKDCVSSDVRWLRELPEHWNIRRLKTAARYCVSNVDKIPADDEIPVRLCNYTDVYYNDFLTPGMGLMEVTATSEEIRKFGLRVNDVVITKDSEDWRDIAVPAMVAEAAPDLVCGYHLAIIRPRAEQIYGPFLLRLFQSSVVNQQFQIAASGVTRYGLPKSAIGEAWIPLPPIDEQQAIARFLDAKTTQIDTLVAKKWQLIDKLKEKRSALIARTVTRGLPPKAANAVGFEPHSYIKHSGVEWLGTVPDDWVITAVWHQFFLGRGRVISHEDIADNPGPYPVYSSQTENGGVLGYLGSFDFDGDYITWTTDGANAGTVFTRSGSFNCTNVCGTLKAKNQDRIDNRYVAYTLSIATAEFVRHDINPKLMNNVMKSIRFALPTKREQELIADFLDLEIGKMEALSAQIEVAISRLTEYRQALITSAVTGKIDVRGFADKKGASRHAPSALS